MFRLLGLLSIVLAAGTSLVACKKSETSEPPPPTTTTAAGGAQHVRVTGTVTGLSADEAVTDPIAPPFTMTVAQRGVGGAEFDGVTVDGKVQQVNWQAGQPLPVRGGGPGLNLNGAIVHVDAGAITWSLDGAGRELLPGAYTLAAPVAVGSGGIAAPVDSVSLVAGTDAVVSTRGGAIITLKPQRLRIEGSRGTLTITGKLILAGEDNTTRRATKVTVGPGGYRVVLTPAAGGYAIDAQLDGTVRT